MFREQLRIQNQNSKNKVVSLYCANFTFLICSVGSKQSHFDALMSGDISWLVVG